MSVVKKLNNMIVCKTHYKKDIYQLQYSTVCDNMEDLVEEIGLKSVVQNAMKAYISTKFPCLKDKREGLEYDLTPMRNSEISFDEALNEVGSMCKIVDENGRTIEHVHKLAIGSYDGKTLGGTRKSNQLQKPNEYLQCFYERVGDDYRCIGFVFLVRCSNDFSELYSVHYVNPGCVKEGSNLSHEQIWHTCVDESIDVDASEAFYMMNDAEQ